MHLTVNSVGCSKTAISMADSCVLYKWPGQQNWVYLQGELVPVDPTRQGFVIAPFRGNAKMITCLLKEESTEFPQEKFSNMVKRAQDDYLFDPLHALDLYHAALGKAIAAVSNGKLKKVVVSRQEHFACRDDHFIRQFPALAGAYPNALVYFLSTAEHGSWFGASPEILVEENETSFTTMALAGTIKSELEIEMKDWKQKEIEEHKYVADYIAALFEKNALGYDRYPTAIHRTGNIHHLISKFILPKNQSTSLFELAGMLNPTPAVCGLPVEESRRFILEHEKYDRSLYTGYLGPIGMPKYNGFYVNLRCGQKIAGGAFLYAGGGINKGSVAGDEFNETCNKMENTWRFFN